MCGIVSGRAISSVGRATCLHHEGHRFESCIAHKTRAPQYYCGVLCFAAIQDENNCAGVPFSKTGGAIGG